MPSFKGIATSRTVSEKKVDNVLISGFQKLFPCMQPSQLEDPARTALMAAISNMGTYAFGAYDNPEVEGFKEVTTTGTTIQHMQLHWLHHALDGILKIQLHEGKGLKDLDGLFGGKSDPYVVFTLCGSYTKSEVIKDTSDPVWNSTHYLPFRSNHYEPDTDAKLNVVVFDSDNQGIAALASLFNGEDHAGSAEVDILKLKTGTPQEMTLQLKPKDGSSKDFGSIRLTVELLAVEKALGELNATESSGVWMDRVDTDDDDMDWKAVSQRTDIGYINTNPVAFIESEASGTQGWVHANFDAKVVVVAFRGTEMTHISDWISDLNALPSSVTDGMKSTSYAVKPTETLLHKDIRLHAGFRNAYDSVRDAVLRIVFDLTGWDKEWTVCVTGHSLGGALATICAFELANRKLVTPPTKFARAWSTIRRAKPAEKLQPQSPKVGLMNFGAPRVGTGEFVRLYNKTVPESLRVVNVTDLVHFIPRIFYSHTNHEIVLDSDGEVQIGTTQLQLSGHTKRQLEAIEAAKNSNDGGRTATSRAFEGISVRTHMQTYYFKTVQAAIDKFMKRGN